MEFVGSASSADTIPGSELAVNDESTVPLVLVRFIRTVLDPP